MARKWLAAVLGIAAWIGAAPSARADIQFTISGPGGFAMTSGIFAGPGPASFTTTIAGFGTIAVNTVVTNSPGGSGGASTMDLTYNVSSLAPGQAGGTFVLTAWANNFTFPGLGPAGVEVRNASTPSPGASDTTQAWVKNDNALTAGGLAPSNLVSPATPDTYDLNFVTTLGASPYTIIERATVVLTGNGQIDSGDFLVRVTPVPAPAGLLLLLSGSPVLGLGYWLRRRRPRATPVS